MTRRTRSSRRSTSTACWAGPPSGSTARVGVFRDSTSNRCSRSTATTSSKMAFWVSRVGMFGIIRHQSALRRGPRPCLAAMPISVIEEYRGRLAGRSTGFAKSWGESRPPTRPSARRGSTSASTRTATTSVTPTSRSDSDLGEAAAATASGPTPKAVASDLRRSDHGPHLPGRIMDASSTGGRFASCSTTSPAHRCSRPTSTTAGSTR